MNYLIQSLLAMLLLIFLLPLFAVIALIIIIDDGFPVIYQQKRSGLHKKVLMMYKFRSMIRNADKLQPGLRKMNEADGPVFKIYNDPRLTKAGHLLFHTGLDELPQLINIIKGEMAFVGPRPLPVKEAKKIPVKYKDRFLAKPGLTSLWVINGNHRLSFEEWMRLDLLYIRTRSFRADLFIIFRTISLLYRYMIKVKKETLDGYRPAKIPEIVKKQLRYEKE